MDNKEALEEKDKQTLADLPHARLHFYSKQWLEMAMM